MQKIRPEMLIFHARLAEMRNSQSNVNINENVFLLQFFLYYIVICTLGSTCTNFWKPQMSTSTL